MVFAITTFPFLLRNERKNIIERLQRPKQKAKLNVDVGTSGQKMCLSLKSNTKATFSKYSGQKLYILFMSRHDLLELF
jgi:hypothetical protein